MGGFWRAYMHCAVIVQMVHFNCATFVPTRVPRLEIIPVYNAT